MGGVVQDTGAGLHVRSCIFLETVALPGYALVFHSGKEHGHRELVTSVQADKWQLEPTSYWGRGGEGTGGISRLHMGIWVLGARPPTKKGQKSGLL